MKIIACIQARMGSARLPGKVMKKILGKTLVQIELERLRSSPEVDQVVLATSESKQNDVLARHAKEIGLPVYRGSEMDLISRLGGAARKFGADALVRVTADNPLVDPKILTEMIKVYKKSSGRVDMVTNSFPRSFPKGLDLDILSSHVFPKLDKEVKDPVYREILTVYMMNNKKFKVINYPRKKGGRYSTEKLFASGLRWTVDYKEDLEFVTQIFQRMKNVVFSMEDILSLLSREPELIGINKNRVEKL